MLPFFGSSFVVLPSRAVVVGRNQIDHLSNKIQNLRQDVRRNNNNNNH